MKICIYGAGAIGGWIGAALARSGSRLNVVARGATLKALQRDGLTLVRQQNGGETRERVPVHAVEDPAELGMQDLVVVAVKAPALASVASRIGPLLGTDTCILTAMNGVPWWFFEGGFGGPLAGHRLNAVDPEGLIAEAIPACQVIGGVVHASCSLDAPGVVRHHFGNGVILGAPSAGTTPRVQQLADQLTLGGLHATVSPQIQKDIWYKLWGNMTVNPISALTGATADKILGDDLVRSFMSRAMREAQAIGACLGVPIAESPEDRHHVTRQLGAFKTSMLQDVEAGKPIELDALVTAVLDIGHAAGVETPFIGALLGLARVQAESLGLYRRSR